MNDVTNGSSGTILGSAADEIWTDPMLVAMTIHIAIRVRLRISIPPIGEFDYCEMGSWVASAATRAAVRKF